MTVQELQTWLGTLPPQAVVLIETEGGLSPLGGVELLANGQGLPDEVLLQPDMTPD